MQFQPHCGLSTGRIHACSMLITMEGKKKGGGDQGHFKPFCNRPSHPFILSSVFAGPHVVHGSISAPVMLYV